MGIGNSGDPSHIVSVVQIVGHILASVLENTRNLYQVVTASKHKTLALELEPFLISWILGSLTLILDQSIVFIN